MRELAEQCIKYTKYLHRINAESNKLDVPSTGDDLQAGTGHLATTFMPLEFWN